MNSTKARMRLFKGHLRLDDAAIKQVLLLQLGNIHCFKSYLVDNLPMIAKQASFRDLQLAIMESVDDIKLQILRMDKAFQLLGMIHRDANCIGVRALMTEAYTQSRSPELSDLQSDLIILYHLNSIESMEMSCYKFVNELAATLPNGELTLLLNHNLDSARDNKELYELITREYIN